MLKLVDKDNVKQLPTRTQEEKKQLLEFLDDLKARAEADEYMSLVAIMRGGPNHMQFAQFMSPEEELMDFLGGLFAQMFTLCAASMVVGPEEGSEDE